MAGGFWGRLFKRGGRLHPLWRVLLYLAALLAGQLALSVLITLAVVIVRAVSGAPFEETLNSLASGRLPPLVFLSLGLLELAYATGLALLMGRFLDREPVETMGFSLARAGRDGALGLLIGLGAMALIGGAQVILRWSALAPGTGTAGSFLLDALALLPAAAAEEVIFRGYVQRALTTWRGPVVGVAVSSVLFSLFHIFNPHLGVLGVLNIALAGAVFALAVEWRGTLWLAVAFHFAWNLTQGPLLGMSVSGLAWNGLLALGSGGPALWTGGPFGPEGGLLATGALLLSVLPLWAVARRPASVAAACRRQRAAVEARCGPLPHVHHRLDVDATLFDDLARSVSEGNREGEVVLALRRADGCLLLHTKDFYPPGTYRLPSGGIRRGEPVLEAARREAGEEAGLSLRDPRPLGLLTYRLRCGRRRLFFHSWLVLGDVEGEPATQDTGERISAFRWVSGEALPPLAAELDALPAPWVGWGRFRAPAHRAAADWLDDRWAA